MKKGYMIDIIMSVFNCEKYIDESIRSIIDQTYTSWRLIICDDGSTDNTFNKVSYYSKKYKNKIILLKNEKNMGLNYSLNRCLKYSNAPYVARMDGDDISDKNRLEREINFLENNNEYSFVSTNALLFDKNGEWGKLNLVERPDRLDFINGSPFCHAATLIRTDSIKEVGGYSVDKKLLRVEDYHLWFKLYASGHKGYNIQDYLYHIRDDRAATYRRTWKNRKNEFYVKKIGFRMLNIPHLYDLYIIKPVILGLMPKRIYELMHKRKLKGNRA